jgi:integrase
VRARLDAVLHLTIQDDCFLFPPQKKERGPRRVPIHSALLPVRQPLWAWKTSAAASQQFITYRRSLGVEPVFHSFRRWFISKAEQAGQPESVIAAVVGHRRPGLTFGRYSSGPGVELMRACVEAVKLPT